MEKEWCKDRTIKPELFAVLNELHAKGEIPFSDYMAIVDVVNPCEFKLQVLTHLLTALQLAGKKEIVRKIIEAMRA